MNPSMNLDAILPSIERAHAEGLALPAAAPASVRRMAGLIVLAGAVRRDSWDEVLPTQGGARRMLVESLEPPTDYVERSFTVALGPVKGDASKTVFRHCNDKVISLVEMYVPTLPIHFALEPALEELADLATQPPDVLLCPDLRPKRAGAAYRDAREEVIADFHGFDFGDALERAADAVARMGVRGTIFLQRVRAYAWPFLWLHYAPGALGPDEGDLFIAPDRAGALRLINTVTE